MATASSIPEDFSSAPSTLDPTTVHHCDNEPGHEQENTSAQNISDLPQSPPPPPPVNGKIRYNVLHLYGTKEMSNQDVKGFFDTYDPHYKLEWVNDLACNIVFDSISVAKDAYQTFGIKVVPFDPEVSAKLTEEEQHYLQWRECEKFHRNTLTGLFLRYAVDKDKKERRAAEKSEYYKKHGRVVEDDMKQPVVDLRQTLQRKRSEAPSEVQEDDDLRTEIALAKKRKLKSSEPRRSVKGDLREDLKKSRSTPNQHQIKPSLRSRLGPYAT